MIKCFKFIFFMFLFCGGIHVYAQKRDTIAIGSVEGIIRDSVRNYVIKSATVSIYRDVDSKLVSYQLSNSFGRFNFKNLPVGSVLKIVVTYASYKQLVRKFSILKETPSINLEVLTLERSDVQLDEVVITAEPPPVMMRGDTIEFNASAFKLDTNAVVGDLLKKLPGITIWGDGLITLNGKKINQVLVDGKPFVSDDPQIALKNLPKNAVEKIQIYKNIDAFNPDTLNAPTDLNIRLKKGMKNGYFGKTGIGVGTDHRYAADGMLIFYAPKTTLSLVGAANNVNKTAYDVNTLLTFNSFSGEDLNSTYQSNFTAKGLNVFKASGLTFDHVLNENSVIKGDYFLSDQNKDIHENNQTTVILPNNQLSQVRENISNSNNISFNGNLYYRYKSKINILNADYSVTDVKSNSLNTQSFSSINNSTGQQSNTLGKQELEDKEVTHTFHIQSGVTRHFDPTANKFRLLNMNLDYSLNLTNGYSNSTNRADFRSTAISNPTLFDRSYLKNFNNSTQRLEIGINDMLGLLKMNSNFVKIDFKNTASFYTSEKTDKVSDIDTTNALYQINPTLSNISKYSSFDERPGLSFTKSIGAGLPERYEHRLTYSFFAQSKLFTQKNASQKAYQQIGKSYFNFIPKATIVYTNNLYGYYLENYSLSYSTASDYPSIDQLAPIVDYSNIYTVEFGNPNLKPSYTHDIAFKFSHHSNKIKNNFQFEFNASGGITSNFISDSVQYDALGRGLLYYANVSNSKYSNVNSSYNKVFNYRKHLFQIRLSAGNRYNQNPSYVNGLYYLRKTSDSRGALNLNYSYSEILNLSLFENVNYLNTKQDNVNSYNFKTWKTGLNAELKWKNTFLISKINYNKTSSSYSDDVHYTLWNLDLGYRFFKGNNGEIKLSALDILRQNKDVVFYSNSNSFTRGTVNVLRQYFMVSFAYYPRKFGNVKK